MSQSSRALTQCPLQTNVIKHKCSVSANSDIYLQANARDRHMVQYNVNNQFFRKQNC